MKKSILFLLIISLLLIPLVAVACDSTSGRNDKVYIDTFRHDGQFVLPVSVTKATMSPDATKYFRSKMSLSQICESVNECKSYEAVLIDDYILVRDTSAGNSTYCIIKPYSSDKFNYLVTNMAFRFQTADCESSAKYFLVPLHMISASIEDGTVISDNSYAFSGTKESLTRFYEDNGYNVTETADGISVEDITGIFYNGKAYFDEVVKKFAVTINDTSVVFRQTD